jgi:hypothetical protein
MPLSIYLALSQTLLQEPLSVLDSNFTKALKAIAVVHSFFAIESEGNLN